MLSGAELTCVDSQVPLQLERVTAGVVAVLAQIGTLASVHANVALQLAQLDRRVVALVAFVRLDEAVPVKNKQTQSAFLASSPGGGKAVAISHLTCT